MPSKAKSNNATAEKAASAASKEKPVKKSVSTEEVSASASAKGKSSAKKASAAAEKEKTEKTKSSRSAKSAVNAATAQTPAAPPVSPPPQTEDGEDGTSFAEFVQLQKQRLLELKDLYMDSMTGMANETLRSPTDGGAGSAFGMHQADAGTDAYDRDFALNLLSQGQDALYEIDEALKRIENGTYGICEMSGKPIPRARLEALPFARFTVECQQQYEKEQGPRHRRPVRSLFGLMGSDEEEDEDERDDTVDNDKD